MLAPSMQSMKHTASRSRRPYAGARAFFAVILIVFLFAIWSHVQGNYLSRTTVGGGGLRRRALDSAFRAESEKPDLEVSWYTHGLLILTDELPSSQCRLVHATKDKCDFVRANCPDEEAGIFSYLQLYYCHLPKAKPVAFVLLVLWLGLLFSTLGIAASDFFCINLGTIASILGMSESMAGVTFLAFGNGSPDVFSTFAAVKSHSGSLALGELIGAACFITTVVAGSMALVRPFKVARKSFIRDVGFFLVAAAFSMVFLADGHLHLWECAVMIGFYVFYVVTVFVWHWYLGQRRRRQEQEHAARGHFLIPEIDEPEAEPYHDDDEDRQTGGSRRPSRGVSAEDFAALERGNSPLLQAMNEADEETRGHWMAEISSNMRVSRPPKGERRNTANPIRPSLVGALEFRAVLSSLEKSRNIQTIPLGSRRFSDDPNYTTAQQQDHMSIVSNPEISYEFVDARDSANDSPRSRVNDNGESIPTRVRAASAQEASGLHLTTSMFAPRDASRARSRERSTSSRSNGFGDFTTSPAPINRSDAKSPTNLLAPPTEAATGSAHLDADPNQPPVSSPLHLAQSQSSISIPRISRSRRSSTTQASSPMSPFPEYYDDPNFVSRSRASSIRLPPSSIGSDSAYLQRVNQDDEERPIAWWPYKALPPPQVLISTLFPTLYSWHDKSWWEKLLGIVSAPSVFLLAITLPVVESQADDDLPETLDIDPGLLSPEHARSRSQSVALLSPDSPNIAFNDPIHRHEHRNLTANSDENRTLISPSIQINGDTANVSQPNGRHKLKSAPNRQDSAHLALPVQAEAVGGKASSPKEWNRWLVGTQLFTAPLFIVLLTWANTDADLKGRNLLLPCLYVLIASLLALALLIVFTDARQPPKYRYMLCFLGFVVSIAWIVTIANEVVGVLKAFGVILGISDAVLGLTIFAVGNSLGDLVADITVARLGFPVMALSACFGGPMLNILLGIGLSGLYMTIRDGHHKHDKHPDRPIHYRPYQIEISPTLVISGVTLVVTLLGLLLVIPLNKWWMDRRVGWALVALWSASTTGNVLVEAMGWGWGVN